MTKDLRNDSRQAVVLLSGGMDSCVSTAIAGKRHGAANIALLHASYGQRQRMIESPNAASANRK